MNDIFAKRLINARKIRCLSQRELSNLLGNKISPTAVAKYEKGLMLPSSDVLIMLSNALKMSLDYFFRPFVISIDTSKFEFRKKASMGKKKVESIKCQVCSDIEKYIEIDSLLGISTDFTLDFTNIVVDGENEAKTLALRFRKEMNVGEDAIVSAIELLESTGIKIIEIEADKTFSGTCIKIDKIPVIVINKKMTSEHKRFTMFHELGHLLMVCTKGIDEEKMCNIFANEVLIPSDRLKRLIGESRKDISLVELKSIQMEYGISVDALMYKASQLNIITDRRYVSFQKKKNALPSFKESVVRGEYPMEYTSRFDRLVYRALASEIITYSKAAALLDKPVSEVRSTLNLM